MDTAEQQIERVAEAFSFEMVEKYWQAYVPPNVPTAFREVFRKALLDDLERFAVIVRAVR